MAEKRKAAGSDRAEREERNGTRGAKRENDGREKENSRECGMWNERE